MALEIRQTLNLSQQLHMTPQLQQAIKLLQLSRLELLDSIQEEMLSNPALEEDTAYGEDAFPEEPDMAGDIPHSLSEVKVAEDDRSSSWEEIDWENYVAEYNSSNAQAPAEEKEERTARSFENFTSDRSMSLSSHLLWQITMSSMPHEDRKIAVKIIENLNDNGYLEISVDEIAEEFGVDSKIVEKIRNTIQLFEPVGVASFDVQECLLVRARFQFGKGSIAETLILNHLKDIEANKLEKVARKLNISMSALMDGISAIQSLEPRPGKLYTAEETVYIVPDIYVFKIGEDYHITQNDDGLPKLRVSSYYQDVLRGKISVPPNVKNYIQEKLRSASWFIKSIHQRQRTIYRVTESIVKFQRDFFENGIKFLKPLVLRDVAEDIDMHESTISRVTTNKYVQTPQGIFELKFFFNSSIKSLDGDSIASESVKDHIRNMIKSEDRTKPLSDQEISEKLEKLNIITARRTVAKYRETMGILTSRQRKTSR